MNAKYLRYVHFDVDFGFLPTDESGRVVAEARATASELDKTRRAVFLALASHIHSALRKARRAVGDMPIRDVTVYLSGDPEDAPKPDLRRGLLEVDIARDPRELLSLADDNAGVGEWVIEVAEQALERLEAWDGRFPVDVVREGIEAFRRCEHAFAFRAGERLVPGTRVKGRIQVVVSCRDTRRYFTALYRNDPLFRVELAAIDRPDIQVSNHFSGFEFADGIITIPANKFWPLDEARRPDYMKPVEIDVRDHPKAYALMREKGWIDTPAGD